MSLTAIDEHVYAASKELRGRGAPDPEVLFLMATGVGLLPSTYAATWRMPLEAISGVPSIWRGAQLIAAEHRDATCWFLEDSPGEGPGHPTPPGAPVQQDWERAFPVWLAACSGATLCVHTSAGSRLAQEDENSGNETLVLVEDHLNLSGHTPLRGMGESRLGPLFPDQSFLHHAGLRKIARRAAERLGLPIAEAVAACSAGPAIETPAERAFYARAGAGVVVQDLADPLIAMSHAGLACLAVVAAIDSRDSATDVGALVAGADRLAPALEELLAALAPDFTRIAFELREEI